MRELSLLWRLLLLHLNVIVVILALLENVVIVGPWVHGLGRLWVMMLLHEVARVDHMLLLLM